MVGLIGIVWVIFRLKVENSRLNKQIDIALDQLDENYLALARSEILAGSNDLFLIIDREGRILESNRQTSRRLLYRKDELLALNIADIDARFAHYTWIKYWQQLANEHALTGETDLIRKDNALVPFKTTYKYVESELGACCICLATDGETLEATAEQLSVAKNQIQELNARLHKKLEQAGKLSCKAKASHALKNQLQQTVANDFKGTLKAILNMLDYIHKTAFGDTQQIFCQNASSSALSLQMSIDNILDLTQAETNKLFLDRVSFCFQAVIDEVFSGLRPLAKDHKLHLHAIIEPTVPALLLGDPTRIKRILFNLVSNAMVNNNTGAIFVRFQLLHEDHHNAQLEISVKDHDQPETNAVEKVASNALTDDERALLDNSHAYTMNIAASQTLIEHMGGKLWPHERPGRSALYFFTLTLATDKPAGSAPHAKMEDLDKHQQVPASDEICNILVIEDSFIQQQIIKLQLRAIGHLFTMTRTGETAIKHLRKEHYDILLIDLTCRKGLETLKNVAVFIVQQKLYVIGMTELQHASIQHCFAQLHINDIISKPIDSDALSLALRCAVAKKEPKPVDTPTGELLLTNRMHLTDSTNDNPATGRFIQSPADQNVQPLSSEEINALLQLTRSPQEPGRDTAKNMLEEGSIANLKQAFIQTTPDIIEQIRQANQRQDIILIKSAVLALKASASYLQAKELKVLLDSVISMANAKNFAEIHIAVAKIKSTFEQVVRQLEDE